MIDFEIYYAYCDFLSKNSAKKCLLQKETKLNIPAKFSFRFFINGSDTETLTLKLNNLVFWISDGLPRNQWISVEKDLPVSMFNVNYSDKNC